MSVMPVHLFWIFGIFFWMAVFVAGAFAIVWLATRASRGGPGQAPQTSPPSPGSPPPSPAQAPLDILATRFARGEITAEEYQKARDLLSGGGSSS